MTELHVTATDFRVHLKEWANQVARGGEPVVMARHGFDMAVLISWEDYQLLCKLKGLAEKGEREVTRFEHPDAMPVEEVQRIYAATAGAADLRTQDWRGKAFVSLRARTGAYPAEPPAADSPAPDPPR
jgi:prevent-host-death family protein